MCLWSKSSTELYPSDRSNVLVSVHLVGSHWVLVPLSSGGGVFKSLSLLTELQEVGTGLGALGAGLYLDHGRSLLRMKES